MRLGLRLDPARPNPPKPAARPPVRPPGQPIAWPPARSPGRPADRRPSGPAARRPARSPTRPAVRPPGRPPGRPTARRPGRPAAWRHGQPAGARTMRRRSTPCVQRDQAPHGETPSVRARGDDIGFSCARTRQDDNSGAREKHQSRQDKPRGARVPAPLISSARAHDMMTIDSGARDKNTHRDMTSHATQETPHP